MRSLRARLLLVSAVVLAGFLGLTGLALDRAFSTSAESALRERLQGHLYALLAAADLNDRQRLELPIELPEPRFNLIGSGLMAEVRDAADATVWRSRSALGTELPGVTVSAPGERVYTPLGGGASSARLMLSFATRWESGARPAQVYVFHVVERLDELQAQIRQFRRGLFGWLDAGQDTDRLAECMLHEGWLIAPGSLFHATPRPTTLMRVNFAAGQDARFWRALAAHSPLR